MPMDVFTDPDNQAVYLAGFRLILGLTAASALLSLVVGVLLAAMRVSPIPVLRGFATAWVNVFRNTPLTLVIFFVFFGLHVNMGLTYSDTLSRDNFWLG